MEVLIVNRASYDMDFRSYNKYQGKVVVPARSHIKVHCYDRPELSYYESLEEKGLKVVIDPELIKEYSRDPSETVSESSPEEDSSDLEDHESKEVDSEDFAKSSLESLSDQELREVISKLGVSTQLKRRDRMIDLIMTNLPEGSTLQNYL